jgi:hypothetical protein
MRRIHIILLFIFSYCAALHAQKDSVYYGNPTPKSKQTKENDDWKERFTYGGNFQAFFGNPTYIYLSPAIGYNLLDDLNIGAGIIYNYASVDYGGAGKFSQSIFGTHSYARYSVTNFFFIQGQYDKLYQPNVYSYKIPQEKVWVDYAMGGVGYSQPLGELATFNTSLMYNFTPHRLSIYPSQFIFQVGIFSRFR